MSEITKSTDLTDAVQKLAVIQTAIQHIAKTSAADREALAQAENDHIEAAADAAVAGATTPKASPSLIALRERTGRADALIAALEKRRSAAAIHLQLATDRHNADARAEIVKPIAKRTEAAWLKFIQATEDLGRAGGHTMLFRGWHLLRATDGATPCTVTDALAAAGLSTGPGGYLDDHAAIPDLAGLQILGAEITERLLRS